MTNPHLSVLTLDATATISRDQAAAVVAAYSEAMSAADADAVAALFSEDATRIDPVGGTPNHGRGEIGDAVRRALPGPPVELRFRAGPLHGSGNVFAFTFAHITTRNGSSHVLHGIDVFAFTPDGLIGYAAAYWGPDDRDEMA